MATFFIKGKRFFLLFFPTHRMLYTCLAFQMCCYYCFYAFAFSNFFHFFFFIIISLSLAILSQTLNHMQQKYVLKRYFLLRYRTNRFIIRAICYRTGVNKNISSEKRMKEKKKKKMETKKIIQFFMDQIVRS